VNEKNNEKPNPRLEALLDYLKRSRGFDFTAYKRSTLQRRVEKRMQAANITDMGEYLDHLEVHPDEFVALFDTILINVTEFFRDPPVWDMLAAEVIPEITRHKAPRDHIRVWSAGCATGEEAYSIAMLLSEALGIEQMRDRVKVYATDADESALNTARLGVYLAKTLQNVPPQLLEKYFVQHNDRCSFDKEARRAVIFGRHDLIQDPPISRVDLLLCRNTLMYFNSESQSRILARFHLALNTSGYLVAGRAEMLLTHGHIFAPVDLKRRIFQKVPKDTLTDRVAMLVRGNRDDDDPEGQILAAAFETATTAQLMLDADGHLVALNQSARQLLKVDSKEAGRPLRDLGPSMWPLDVQRAIEHAYADLVPAELKNVEWPDVTGQPRYYNVSITPLRGRTGAPSGVTVLFEDVTAFRNLYQQLHRSRQELETMSEELQSSNEELETTNEELQSTVEELETTNEELQSTNEELETMNEELQSTNEQLHTTNDELQTRGDELNAANAFLQAILSSMQHGLAVLDTEGRVTNWNARAEGLWGLRAEEVRGKPFLSLDIGLPLDQLVRPIRKCLAGERCELTLTAVNRNGKQIRVRVQCTPMNPAGQAIEGAVILMDEPESRE
jgi:two-component system, chemotaxis family, CheB/CheR fusion protein